MFRDIDRSIQLTILDGVIGEVISRQIIQEKLASALVWQDYGYSEEEFKNLDPDLKQDLIEAWS